MSIFTIDDAKCNRCGFCVLECPPRIIEIKEPQALPTMVKDHEDRCITCGHCVSVCPFAAIALKTMKPEDCSPQRSR